MESWKRGVFVDSSLLLRAGVAARFLAFLSPSSRCIRNILVPNFVAVV
jgi:hypothetical protein